MVGTREEASGDHLRICVRVRVRVCVCVCGAKTCPVQACQIGREIWLNLATLAMCSCVPGATAVRGEKDVAATEENTPEDVYWMVRGERDVNQSPIFFVFSSAPDRGKNKKDGTLAPLQNLELIHSLIH